MYETEYVVADANAYDLKNLEISLNQLNEFDSNDLRVGDQICIDSSEGEIWFRVANRIFVHSGCKGIRLIIQLKTI